MFFKPDLIVYVWLIPAFIIFIFPVLFLPLILVGEKAFAKRPRAEKNALYEGFATRDNRAHPRHQYDGIFAHVSDGVHCCRVSVNNISKLGINFAYPSDKLDRNADKLGVLLTGSGQTFPMQVRPKWKELQGTEQNIGATIVNAPPELWDEFTGSVEIPRVVHGA